MKYFATKAKHNPHNSMKNNFFKNIMSSDDETGSMIPIFPDLKDIEPKDTILPDQLPIVPLRNSVLFPDIIMPISLGRESSLQTMEEAYKSHKKVMLLTQKNAETDKPKGKDLYSVGTIGYILKILELPDGSKTSLIKGFQKATTNKIYTKKGKLYTNDYAINSEEIPPKDDQEFEGILYSIKELSVRVIKLSSGIPQEAIFAIKNIGEPDFLINFVASNSDIEAEKKQTLIEAPGIKERGKLLMSLLTIEIQKLEIKNEIQSKVKNEIGQQQKEYLLNQEIKAIQEELGTNSNEAEIEEIEEQAKKIKWTKQAKEAFDKNIKRLKIMNPMSPDYSVQLGYLQTLIDLPWNQYTKDNFDLISAQKILDTDHYGMEKVKERIIEHLAVLKMKGNMKAPILCLYGPPGVGKTSLGKSIAQALGRKYIRMSLGGLHDEAEIRGHRKTYIGAMPGRIIQNLKKAKSSNPVFVLDEIDKVGADFKGDPSSALLEVLDPEQNTTFYDNYLEVEFDLSKVLFIATANNIYDIKPALLDRMELIKISGYIKEEKIQIAKRHLIPKQLKEHGLNKSHIQIDKPAINEIISHYTMESGVRGLEKKIAEVMRKITKKIITQEEYPQNPTKDQVAELLGTPIYRKEQYEGNDKAGVVTGLAWTSAGGKILYTECVLSKGNGQLNLTGNLGNVMKESAIIALEYIKANADKFKIDERIFSNYNIHLHVPEGATPKDGPSAGITIFTAIISALTQRKVRNQLAMTGELSLRGKVLPIGGTKEKVLAAKRAGIKHIILSPENQKDIDDIDAKYLKGLNFHYMETLDEIYEFAILKQKVSNPKKFKFKANSKNT